LAGRRAHSVDKGDVAESLPMMLLAIGGLFGFARVNKQRKAVAA
jgi:hypothetical protein